MTACSLASFATAMPEGPLCGLRWHEGAIAIDADYFACCDGTGMQWQPRKEMSRVSRCQLRQRFTQLARLMDQLHSSFAAFSWQQFFTDRAAAAAIARRYQGWLSGEGFPALVSNHQLDQPSEALLAALLCSWRNGAHLHIVDFSGLANNPLLPAESFVTASGSRIILAERVDRLWDSYSQNAFEQLIAFADTYDCLLHVDLVRREARTSEPAALDRKSAFAKRIARRKQQDPLSQLSTHALSRLKAMAGLTVSRKSEGPDKPKDKPAYIDIDIGF